MKLAEMRALAADVKTNRLASNYQSTMAHGAIVERPMTSTASTYGEDGKINAIPCPLAKPVRMTRKVLALQHD